MAKNDDVQDERYVVLPWMAKNDDVQDERSDFSSRQIISTWILAGNVVLPWMAKNDDVQDEWSWPFSGISASCTSFEFQTNHKYLAACSSVITCI